MSQGRRRWIRLVAIVAVGAVMAEARSIMEDDVALELSIIHINDIHAHFEEVNEYTGRCRAEEAAAKKCYGGFGRIYTKVHELRQQEPEALFLNAGDVYQGTIWYTLFKYKPVAEFSNMVNYTAMGLGNHDFDDGIPGLVPFAETINFELLASNLEETGPPVLTGHYKKSTVVKVSGQKVGIIGYITRNTSTISSPGPTIEFHDEIESVAVEARRLKDKEGVNILIAVGHAGYNIDMEMAKQIPEIDLVVGGHSHTFLYTGTKPSVEEPSGPYPTYITQESGKIVPVVQVYCYTKYLGFLKLAFDAEGELMQPVNSAGVTHAEVILLDSSIAKDPYVEQELNKYRGNLTEYTEVIGRTNVFLQRMEQAESNIGDFITDSMINAWNDTTIAFMNDGGIRSDLTIGDLTGEDIYTVLPFNNTVDRVILSGAAIKSLLEEYAEVMCMEGNCSGGKFLQMSGLKVVYDIRVDNAGSRVTSLQVRCPEASNMWCNLDTMQNYTVAMTKYIARIGSRNFPDNIIEGPFTGPWDYDIFKKWVIHETPITQQVEDRITINYHHDLSSTQDPSN